MFEAVYPKILAHAEDEAPNECCGLVGEFPWGLAYYRARNVEAAPSGFLLDPHDQFEILADIEARQGQMVAIAHSHPNGSEKPSERDCRYAGEWPRVAMLIAADGAVHAYTPEGEPWA